MQFDSSNLDRNTKAFKELGLHTENYLASTREYMSYLAQAFRGTRAVAMFNEWNSLQAELDKSIQTFGAVNELLERVSDLISSADQDR